MALKIKKKYPFKKILWLLFFVFFGTVYFINLTRDIYGGDVGDVVTAALVGGVAHPPGYPIYVMLGYFFGHLPLPLEPVTRVGLLSVVAALVSLFLFRKIISYFSSNVFIQLVSTAIVGLSSLFWLYAEIPEVFALNICFSLNVIYFSLEYYKKNEFKYLLLAFFMYGLGFTNHQSIVLTLPFLITIFVVKRKTLLKLGRRLLLLPLVGMLGLLPYLYLPIAAAGNPVINWNNIHSVDDFFHHVLRRDYGTFSAGAFRDPFVDAKLVIVKTYLLSLWHSLTVPVLVLVTVGILHGMRKYRAISIGIILSALVSGPFFVIYSGFPISDYFVLGVAERFYLLSHVILLLFVPLGFEAVYSFCSHVFSRKIYAKALLLVFILIPILMFKVNFPKNDLSKTRLGTDYAKDYLRNLPKGAVLFLSGDTRSFNIWYVYYILKFRNDIRLVQIGNFGIDSAYFNKTYYDLKKNTGFSDSDLFINSLLEIEKKDQVYSVTATNIPKQSYIWLPIGMSNKLFKKSEIPTRNEYKKILANQFKNVSIPYDATLLPSERNYILRSVVSSYAASLFNIGETYYTIYSDIDSAEIYYKSALLVDPTSSYPYSGLAKTLNLRGKCSEAEVNIKKSIELNPIDSKNYIDWYLIAKQCYKDDAKSKRIKSEFKRIFKQDVNAVVEKTG